jgi:hypothetical protein
LSSSNSSPFLDDPIFDQIVDALNEPVQNANENVDNLQVAAAAASLNEPVQNANENVDNLQVAAAAAAFNEPVPEPLDDDGDDDDGVPRTARFFKFQAEYDLFRQRFDALIDEHIPRRYRNLNFRMEKLAEFNLKTPLKQIDGKQKLLFSIK